MKRKATDSYVAHSIFRELKTPVAYRDLARLRLPEKVDFQACKIGSAYVYLQGTNGPLFTKGIQPDDLDFIFLTPSPTL